MRDIQNWEWCLSSAIKSILEGNIASFNHKPTVDRLVKELHNIDGHNGVVIAGCKPWYISIMPKMSEVKAPKLYSCEEFEYGKFYRNLDSCVGHVFMKVSSKFSEYIFVSMTNYSCYDLTPGKRYSEVDINGKPV